MTDNEITVQDVSDSTEPIAYGFELVSKPDAELTAPAQGVTLELLAGEDGLATVRLAGNMPVPDMERTMACAMEALDAWWRSHAKENGLDPKDRDPAFIDRIWRPWPDVVEPVRLRTVEELLALPGETLVMDKYGCLYQKDTEYDLWHRPGDEMSGGAASMDLPVTVVPLPEVE